MAIRVGLAVALAAFAGCGGGSGGPPPEPSSERVSVRPLGSVEGAPLGYVEYLPPDGDGTSRPLLVFLHGAGESGDGSEAALDRVFVTGVPTLIKNGDWPADRPFIVLMPQHPNDPTNICFTGDEVDSFLSFALKHYDVDEDRVYLTGLSCGAIGAWDYLSAHRDVVAAAVLIAGDATPAFARAGCDLGRVPIWAFHGDVDSIVPARLAVVPIRRLKACTSPRPIDLRLTIYPDIAHDSWTRTYDLSAGHDVYAWLLAHER